MITLEEFTRLYLSQNSDNPLVAELLLKIGCETKPHAKRDEPDFFADSAEFQIELLFEDEDYLKKIKKKYWGTAPMILTTATIDVSREKLSRTPLIKLPIDISFNLGRPDILATMKTKPSNSIKYSDVDKYRNDIWDLGGYRLVYIYQKDETLKRVQIISTKY